MNVRFLFNFLLCLLILYAVVFSIYKYWKSTDKNRCKYKKVEKSITGTTYKTSCGHTIIISRRNRKYMVPPVCDYCHQKTNKTYFPHRRRNR